jgi:hypothetical protein
VRKLGLVLSRTNFKKHTDFVVDARFVENLLKRRKITYDMAIREFVWARDRAHSHVMDARRTRALEASVAQEIVATSTQEQWSSLPFLPPNAAERDFLAQFRHRFTDSPTCALTPAAHALDETGVPAEWAEPPRRYNFLIYDGAPKMGKTERACHWFGREQTLVLNSQGCTFPNMREFLTGTWRAVVYDEADWRLVALNRLLLQSGPRPVMLGQSN